MTDRIAELERIEKSLRDELDDSDRRHAGEIAAKDAEIERLRKRYADHLALVNRDWLATITRAESAESRVAELERDLQEAQERLDWALNYRYSMKRCTSGGLWGWKARGMFFADCGHGGVLGAGRAAIDAARSASPEPRELPNSPSEEGR
jgi:hypothetical protein